MTISSTTRKAGPYSGNDLAVAFPFAFKVFDTSDVYVVYTSPTNEETVLALNTDYTVALNSNQDTSPGGTVTLPTALPSSTKLTITSSVDNLQPVDLTNNGGFYPTVINKALDRATIQIQQLAEKVGRALVWPISSATASLPVPEAGKFIGWNATADSLVNLSGVAVGDAQTVSFSQSGSGAVTRTAQDKMRESVSVKDFGAVGDGVTDDTAAIQNAIDSVALAGGGVIDCSGGKWLIDSAHILVKKGVTLQGQWNNAGEELTRDYTSFDSCFILNSSYSIKLNEDFSAIKGMVIVRKGITIPTSLVAAGTHVAAFAGTAILVGDGTSGKANDTYAGYCLILGFQYAYYNDYNERPRIEYLSGDNINGIYLNRVYDMNHLVGCHFWPYTTTHQAWTLTGDAGWRRQGTAYYFGLGVDWGQANNCFSYGYDNGFHVNGSDNVVLLNCGNDGWKDNNTYSVGFRVEGTTKNLNLIGCKVAAKNTGVLIDITGGGASQCVKITGGNLWAASSGTGSHVYVKNGSAILSSGLSMFDGPVGVKTDSSAGQITITNCVFQSITTPYSISNTEKATIFGNSFDSSKDSSTGVRYPFDSQNGNLYYSYANSYGATGTLYFKHCAGSLSSPSVSPGGVQSFKAIGQAYDGSAYGSMGVIRFQSYGGSPGAGTTPGAFFMSTTPAGSVSATDRVLLTNSGVFMPSTDNTYTLGQSGNRWSAVWAANGTIQTSDLRTKNNVSESVLGLNFINSLRPVSYTWKVGGNEVVRQVYRDSEGNEVDGNTEGAIASEIITKEIPGSRTHWGLIAQEVKAATDAAGVDFAGWVLTDKDDPDSQQALRYDQFIAPLIKAVQEQQVQIDRQDAVIGAMQNQLELLVTGN